MKSTKERLRQTIGAIALIGVTMMATSGINDTYNGGHAMFERVFKYTYDKSGNRILREYFDGKESVDGGKVGEVGDVKVYPAITDGLLTVETTADLSKGSLDYSIVSLDGAELETGTITESTSTLDVSQQTEGLYILKVEAVNNQKAFKIIKK